MKLFLLVAALCALCVAQDNSAIKIDLGSIVQTNINDPQACLRDETCYPLVGYAGEGLNRRRGAMIFNWPTRSTNGAVEAQTVGNGAAKATAQIGATTPDTTPLFTFDFRATGGAGVALGNSPTLIATQTPAANYGKLAPIADHIQNLNRASGAFTTAGKTTLTNGAQGAGRKDGSSFQLGNWLAARSNGLVRCKATEPYAVLDLWFTKLVPQGLYSIHEVTYLPSGAANYRTALASGSSASYFTAQADGSAYINRWLPGNSEVNACPFKRTDRATGSSLNDFLGYEVRYHSNGMALGAAEEIARAITNTNLFTTTGTTVPVLGYGISSHHHLTVSFPHVQDDSRIATTSIRNFRISNQFIV